LQKILIISYFFPPCELTASRRTESWAKELTALNYDVHVLTRKWETPVKTFKDMHKPTSEGIGSVIKDGYRITSVPHKSNLRDKLLIKSNYVFLRKILTIKELIFQNIFLKYSSYYSFYEKSREIIKADKNQLVIISGQPFVLFKLGFLLNKEFNINWVSDFRDAWTTSSIDHLDRSFLFKIYQKYDRFFEKKWIKSSVLITSSSNEIGNSISQLTKTPNKAIFNGYDENLFKGLDNVKKRDDIFQIAYIGTLYRGQDITIFLNGFKSFIKKLNPTTKILFPGLLVNNEEASRVKKHMVGYEKYFEISERISHDKILKIERESHILLHVAWKGFKGIIASKIYEYIGSETSILISPGDDGAINEIINSSNTGVICNTPEEVSKYLCENYLVFKSNSNPISLTGSLHTAYTRKAQAKELEKEIRKFIA
jgi:glycosyltransferase involved in cell wall biosynthesis